MVGIGDRGREKGGSGVLSFTVEGGGWCEGVVDCVCTLGCCWWWGVCRVIAGPIHSSSGVCCSSMCCKWEVAVVVGVVLRGSASACVVVGVLVECSF